MKKVVVLINHRVETEQALILIRNFGIDPEGFVYPDQKIRDIWSSIDPEGNLTELKPVKDFILENSRKNDYVLVQGEHGATFNITDFCFKNDRIPIHATSERVSNEIMNKNNEIVKTSVFKIVNYRKYKKEE